MTRQQRVLLACGLLVAVLLGGAAPAAAQATHRVQCAVKYNDGYYGANVVLTVGTYNTAAGIRDAGAACTDMIAGGYFYGVNKFTNWELYGYQRLCHVSFDGGIESMVVHITPDYLSRVGGVATCEAARAYGLVTYL
jgi:hypothetical protein